ncbi:hypothetical protein BC832DRAFT_565036 [Gaertneriomyces semiglobifer]|nr:hypothetical protein BC832DRAFT_565036 [Gaertneriomyces semiglobifer]
MSMPVSVLPVDGWAQEVADEVGACRLCRPLHATCRAAGISVELIACPPSPSALRPS